MALRTRRTVLKLLGVGAGGVAAGGVGLAQESDGSFALVQDDRCRQVEPLAGSEPVEAFYDWEPNPEHRWSYNGPDHLTRLDTSVAFLYEGPEGTSLVFVHGSLAPGSDETDGGSVSFDVRDLPTEGEWVVEDDNYEGPNNFDVWAHEEGRSRIDWTWAGGRTDGGAFRGLTDDAAVEVRPEFNEDAELFGVHYDGRVSSWQFLSGDLDDPERIDLAMDEELVVRGGDCPDEGDDDSGRGPPDDSPGRGPPDDGDDGDGDEGPGRGPPDENPGRGPPDENPGRGPPEDGDDGEEDDDDDDSRGRGPPDGNSGRGPPDDGEDGEDDDGED